MSPLRPLFDSLPEPVALGAVAEPTWFLADLEAEGSTPWDAAHGSVARRLGIDEFELLFAEPGLPQSMVAAKEIPQHEPSFALGKRCEQKPQTTKGGRVQGPGFVGHLGEALSQLGTARSSVPFAAPRVRIAHIDTGFDARHMALPEHVLLDL